MFKYFKNFNKDKVFQAPGGYTEVLFKNGNFLFQKFWYVPWLNYNFTLLPGKKKGISGSTLGGYNVSINKFINEERKKAAATVLRFIGSLEMQKKIINEYEFLTSISSLYEDKDVCSHMNCELLRNIQFVARPTVNSSDYSKYSEQFRNAVFKYIYGDDDDLSTVINEIEHLTKPYYITINPKMNLCLFIITILTFLSSILMIFSLIFLFKEKFKANLKFLPTDFWILSIIGAVLIMNSFYLNIGKINILKCFIKSLILIIGFDFNMIPILYKLLVNFPIENKYSKWIAKNKLIFFSLFIIYDIIIIGITLISSSLYINRILTKDGVPFDICKLGLIGYHLILLTLILKGLISFIMIIFVFLEWHLEQTINDIKFTLSAITVDILCFIIIFIMIFTNFKYNYYIVYQKILSIILYIFSFSNYIFLYLIKIIKLYIKNDNYYVRNNVNEYYKTNGQNDTENSTNIIETIETDSNIENYYNNRVARSSFDSAIQRMIKCHYQSKIENHEGPTSKFQAPRNNTFYSN